MGYRPGARTVSGGLRLRALRRKRGWGFERRKNKMETLIVGAIAFAIVISILLPYIKSN